VYDEAKRFAEAMTYAYHRYHGVDVRVARIFNTFGPGMRPDDGRAVPTFIQQALDGEPLTVHGDGSQTRSLCYVDDEVEGLLRLLLSDYTDPVNVGNPEEITVRELAELIIELADSDSEITYTPRPTDDPEVRQPDTTVAERELDWKPQTDLREGLRRTVAWFRDRTSRPGAR
ncbi:MAG: GDP-mannose 4,6-dehydratase, partial [Nitriliruptorales bacterium]|nr:GDP-mannose 4,6-dehydratase [Nitriliruptorales bacterium]